MSYIRDGVHVSPMINPKGGEDLLKKKSKKIKVEDKIIIKFRNDAEIAADKTIKVKGGRINPTQINEFYE